MEEEFQIVSHSYPRLLQHNDEHCAVQSQNNIPTQKVGSRCYPYHSTMHHSYRKRTFVRWSVKKSHHRIMEKVIHFSSVPQINDMISVFCSKEMEGTIGKRTFVPKCDIFIYKSTPYAV